MKYHRYDRLICVNFLEVWGKNFLRCNIGVGYNFMETDTYIQPKFYENIKLGEDCSKPNENDLD